MSGAMEDASTRLSLLSSASTVYAPPKASGVTLTSADGTAKLKFSGQFQFRHVINHREGDGIDNDDFGFEHRRIRPKVSGSVLDGKVPFEFFGEFARTATFTLVDAWVGYVPGEGQRFRLGQYVAPFSREEMVSSSRRLASDYTLSHNYFTLERTQGLEYRLREGDWGYYVMFGEGVRDKNTPYTMDADYGLTARVERKSEADWKRHDDFVGWRGEELAWLAGAAVHVSGGQTDADGDLLVDDDYKDLRGTVDFGIEGDGWNAFAALFGQSFDIEAGESFTAFGATIQGGVFVTDDVDIFAQYAWADDDAGLGILNVITVGTNYYIHGHVLKLTVDANYALDEITSTYNSSSRGFRTDAMGQDGQFVVRTQIQALF
ncbi:MAG: hypothetical protein KDA31_11045 [Phycisphaerales bacterium]|nr:hypothetical protein [Phycisphaerales bacterium]MCB9835299.1 hypothetical protein [Phycisphaera sp.]